MTATLSRSTFIGLRCKECGHSYEASARHVCEDVCFGPLEVVYDYDAIRSRVSRATIEAGPASIWRYREFLPIEGDPIDVGTGFTPLLRANRQSAASSARCSVTTTSGRGPDASRASRVVGIGSISGGIRGVAQREGSR
jgi:threonine synthase